MFVKLGNEKCLDQLKPLLKAIPGARLALVGKGPAEASLKKMFKGTKCKFMGLMQGERLSQAFASVDIFVMPSDTETLGKRWHLFCFVFRKKNESFRSHVLVVSLV